MKAQPSTTHETISEGTDVIREKNRVVLSQPFGGDFSAGMLKFQVCSVIVSNSSHTYISRMVLCGHLEFMRFFST